MPDFLALAQDLLRRGIGVRFRARGHSMSPTIRDGEAVHVRPVREEEIRRGDILFYRRRRGAAAHRVARIDRDDSGRPLFFMKDDAMGNGPEAVPSQRVIGKVVRRERRGRTVPLDGVGRSLLQRARAAARRLAVSLRRRA